MFKVGDSALIIKSVFRPDLSGTVCTIIEPYTFREMLLPDGSTRVMGRYIVRLHDGTYGGMSFRNLRHINPPEETASWDMCAFKPVRVPHESNSD